MWYGLEDVSLCRRQTASEVVYSPVRISLMDVVWAYVSQCRQQTASAVVYSPVRISLIDVVWA